MPKTTSDLAMNSSRLCDYAELPFIFEFAGVCSKSSKEGCVYGTTCLEHTNSSGRSYAMLKTANVADLQPIALRQFQCSQNLFLYSFLTNVSLTTAQSLLSYMDKLNSEEMQSLVKFISIISESEENRPVSQEYQNLKVYLNHYCAAALNVLKRYPERNRIQIPIVMSEGLKNMAAQNAFYQRINYLIANNKINYSKTSDREDAVKIAFVPLSEFNILDQLNMLSLRIFTEVGRMTLSPNAALIDTNIMFGYGNPILDYPESMSDLRRMNQYFGPKTMEKICESHGKRMHYNLQVIVLQAVAIGENAPFTRLCINRLIKNSNNFDVDRVYNKE